MCGWQGCLSGEGTGVGERYEKDKRKKTNKWEMWSFHEVEFAPVPSRAALQRKRGRCSLALACVGVMAQFSKVRIIVAIILL